MHCPGQVGPLGGSERSSDIRVPLGGGRVVLAVLVSSVFVGLVLLAFLNRSDPDRLSAWSTFGLMVATFGLVAGSAVAAWYFHRQTVETKELRTTTLRPKIVITKVERARYKRHVLDVELSAGVTVEVELNNLGVGPALEIEMEAGACYHFAGAWGFLTHHGCSPPTFPVFPLPLGSPHRHLAAGRSRTESLMLIAGPDREALEMGVLHYRLSYVDVFGNRFTEQSPLPESPFVARWTFYAGPKRNLRSPTADGETE